MEYKKTYYLKDGSIYTRTGPYIWDIEDLNIERLRGNRFITISINDDDLKQVLVAIDDVEKIELREIKEKEEEE